MQNSHIEIKVDEATQISRVTAPLQSPSKRQPNNFVARAITDAGNDVDMYDSFFYSNAAYCNFQEIANWQCFHCKQRNDLRMQEIYDIKADGGKISGYIGFNKNRIFITMRGTVTLENILTDATIPIYDYTTRGGIKFGIQVGLKEAVTKLMDEIRRLPDPLLKKLRKEKVIITGHSLGGALANLLAVYLEDNGYINWVNTSVYTFGQPRVGDQNYANYLNTRKGANILRVVNSGDIFSNLPNRVLGYSHNAHLKFYHRGKEISCDSSTDIPECSSFINPLTAKEHTVYLGYDMSESCLTILGTPILNIINKFKILDEYVFDPAAELPL